MSHSGCSGLGGRCGLFKMGMGKWMVAALSAGLWAAPAANAATPVFAYDDFANPAASNGLWVKDVAGAGSVTFTGGEAVLDMSSPTAGKAARMDLPETFTMNQVGGEFRVTWDQQILQDNINAFGSGFALMSGGTMIVSGEQVGRQNDGLDASPFLPHHFLLYAQNGAGTYGAVDGGTNEQHFDFSIDGSAVSLSVYACNAAFDATPDSYLAGGTLLEKITATMPALSGTAPLTGLFADEDFTGTDGYLQTRAEISVDNVFISALNVPEPGTLAVLGAALAIGLMGRRRLPLR